MLNREERKLLHHKSKQPTLGRGKPDESEGFEGDIAYRKIEGSGTVQYIKQDGSWVAMSSSGTMPPKRSIIKKSEESSSISIHSSLSGLLSDDHSQYLLVDGTRAMTGNLNMGSQNIGSVTDLDVDGHTTLDRVSINTTDGVFFVTGSNDVDFRTTGSGQYKLLIAGTCDWNTSVTDWDNSGAFDLTSVGDITIETSGADTDKTILIKNTNNDTSAFRGIHLKVDSQGTASSQNSILIECDNRASKGGGIGVDIRSEDGVLIRGEDANNSDKSNVQIRATSSIDLGGGTNSITATIGVPERVKVHGIFETSTLYRPATDKVITTDIGTNTDGDATKEHVRFEAIDTYNLVRAMTHKASGTITNGSTLTIVDSDNDDNQIGTVWKVTIYWHNGSNNPNLQIWYCFLGTTSSDTYYIEHKEVESLDSGGGSGTLTWTSSSGIVWTNNSGSDAITRASALKIQSASDF